MDKLGIANLTANLLNKGTKNKTVEELEAAIQDLGASIYISSDKESISISATTLSRNYKKTLAIVKEMLLNPRFEKKEFNLLKKAVVSGPIVS